MTEGMMKMMYVPAGAIGRFQVNDTHMHKYVDAHTRTQTRSRTHIIRIQIIYQTLKDVVKIAASNWDTAQIVLYKTQLNPPATSGKQAITKTEYLIKVGKLMSLPILREKAPDWLNCAIEHLSKADPKDLQDRNTISRVYLFLFVLNKNNQC
jgi:hypothetical protein